MNTNQILSADLLDLVFDDRNKEYGAYELRKSYQKRIRKALLITSGIVVLAVSSVLATSLKSKETTARLDITQIDLSKAPEPDPPQPPPPVQPPPPERVRTIKLTTPIIVDEVVDPPPTQDEMQNAIIDIKTQDGADFTGIVTPNVIDGSKGIIQENNNVPQGPLEIVEVDAKFVGNWTRFLEKNLRGEVPVDNGAPTGKHRVVIRFVVDLDGSVSDIRAMTNIGFGMEEEAIRVIKKAGKWEPAIQNGHTVKAYRSQSVVFVVEEQ